MYIRQYTQALLGEPSFTELVQYDLASSIIAQEVLYVVAFFSAWLTYTIDFFKKSL